MSGYEIALFAHLVGLMLLTGGVTVSIAAKAVARRRDNPLVIATLWQLAYRTVRFVAMPGSLLLLIAGGALVELSDGAYSWSEPWIAAAVVFWVASALIGIFLHGPRSRAVREQAQASADDGQQQAATELLDHVRGGVLVGTIDALLLLIMVALMVFKPG